MRTQDYLFIRNFAPERWPAGDPQSFGSSDKKRKKGKKGEDAEDGVQSEPGKLGRMHGAYHDIDGSPTLELITRDASDPKTARFLQLAVAKRPADELYDVRKDPGCLVNLATDPAHQQTRQRLAKEFETYLRSTGDVRVTGNGEIWESYPRYSPLREFPKK